MDSGERDLIQNALAGDAESFELLMNAYGLRVYAIAYAILQDRQDAEDCAQDAFFKAWRARRQVREPEKFPAWLLTITRYAARDRLRRRATRPATVPLTADPAATGPAYDDESDQQDRVHALLSTLPERHRTALTLRYLEGLDHAAIEQAMALSNGALRGVLSRALDTMRRGLRPASASSLSDAL